MQTALTLRARLLVACLTVVATASAVVAGVCGDDVRGERVACRCGDTVVSSTRLRPTDPVAVDQCDRDGLRVDAPDAAPGIILDLGGLSITGTGNGTGIRVIDGGREGAILTGGSTGAPATVATFRVGISARGKRTLSEIENVVVTGCADDGIVLESDSTKTDGVVVQGNRGKGLRVGGRGQVATGVHASHNGKSDVDVKRGAGSVERAEVQP